MKSQYVITAILVFVLSFNLGAQVEKYAFGDSIYVWASSLNLRVGPSLDSKIIGNVPYGSLVVIVDEEIGKNAHRNKAIASRKLENGQITKPFYLHGFWVKVNFDGAVGYMFDGYLSGIRPLLIKHEYVDWVDLEKWATLSYGLSGVKSKEYSSTCGFQTEYFKPSSPIGLITGRDKCSCEKIKVRVTNQEEALMIALHIYQGSLVTKTKNGFEIFVEGSELCRVTVQFEKDHAVIYRECCC